MKMFCYPRFDDESDYFCTLLFIRYVFVSMMLLMYGNLKTLWAMGQHYRFQDVVHYREQNVFASW